MSTSSILPSSLLGSLGLPILQDALDAAFGAGVVTISADSSGVSAGLALSGGQTINIDDLTVNAQGLSGRLYIDGLDTNPLTATLFDGFTVSLTAFDITLAQSGLAASHIGGSLTVPFFTDSNGDPETVDIEISTNSKGDLTISLAAIESTQGTTPDGLVQLQYSLGDVGSVELDVASVEITEVNSVWTLVISGNLVIETADLSWPSIELQGLGIDSKGHISLQGGWIDLPNQMALDFYGFHVGLQKLGFGTDSNGDKWIGFNGDINLVEGLTLGGSVRGLQINLTHPAVSLAGVGISFEIPDVLTIDGEVDHFQVTDAQGPQDLVNAGLPGYIFDFINPAGPAPPQGKQVNVFAGAVKLVIDAGDMDLEIDANFIVGTFGGQSVFFLDVDAELPVGIPLFLDVALYGLQGLVATGLEPAPEPTYTWWQWFKYPAAGESGGSGTTTGAVDLSGTPDYSATDFYKWLVPSPGAFAIGAGATIGTAADDGYTVSAAIMFVLMLPGPIISFIGKANILSPRIGGASADADFDAMATYDGNSQTFDLTIDAQYTIPVVLELQATAELYVGEGQWYFALGKPPHEKRISARIFDLFESDAYFVVSDTGLVTGTWTGYKNSWSFGPLSASVDAYLATLAAIQWSPLQIGGGIELYGNVQLSAFGIHIGLTADALLEGCAPNPFWIHGELSVELDLPWPLPNIGATISLTWGGDDGSVPPAPLALSHLDATLVDHCDSADKPASDHYTLLAHGKTAVSPDLTVTYDPVTPGILGLTASTGRTATSLPDLIPDNSSSSQLAPVLPQDAHFTLNFAQGTCDNTGVFGSALPWGSFPTLPAVPSLPPANLIGADDMSNINPNPPAVQFLIRHTLLEVALYEFNQASSTWSLVCSTATPTVSDPPIGVTQLSGVWLSATTSNADPRQAMTQLKVVPWRLLPGVDFTAQWTSASQIQVSGSTFTDQGLTFTLAAGISAPIIGSFEGGANTSGLLFRTASSVTDPVVSIRFAQPCILNSITALIYVADGELNWVAAPACFGDGVALTPESSWQDPTSQAWTLNFADTGPSFQELTIPITGALLVLYSIDYSTAPVPMAILPDAPALYALATVTMIEAERVGAPSFQAVPYGDPIVEFAYFQTVAGPGTVQGTGATVPVPNETAPYPQLQQNCSPAEQPASASPLAGALTDLHTYTQWSWPLDGATAAYFGYDVNVEFEESYVNALYTAFSNGIVDLSLHFRCVDRNNNHTMLVPNAIHVPSIPQQSALAAGAELIPLPSYVPQTPVPVWTIGNVQQGLLQKRAAQAVHSDVLAQAAPVFAQQSLSSLIREVNFNPRGGSLGIQQIDPGLAGELLHDIAEYNAGQKAEALWFKPFLPSTRYTLDVVAGPLYTDRDSPVFTEGSKGQGLLSAVIDATDAIGLLAALQAYFAFEDSLTSLERVQFTTSRYENFAAHLANAASQLASASGATPVRNYVAATTPLSWLGTQLALITAWATAGAQYLTDRQALASLVASFDPLADDLQPGNTTITNGASALVSQRKTVAADWTAFSQVTNTMYDGLITALGHPELADNTAPIAVPDTEISLFTDSTGLWVNAILIQSPEPLPWQRIWRWIRLTNSANASDPVLPIWNADGTIGLLLPAIQARGFYNLSITFQGNLGAEAPCITKNGYGVTETVAVGPIRLGPLFIRHPIEVPVPVQDRPLLDLAPELKAILQA